MPDMQLVEQVFEFLFATRAIKIITVLEDGENVLFYCELAEN